MSSNQSGTQSDSLPRRKSRTVAWTTALSSALAVLGTLYLALVVGEGMQYVALDSSISTLLEKSPQLVPVLKEYQVNTLPSEKRKLLERIADLDNFIARDDLKDAVTWFQHLAYTGGSELQELDHALRSLGVLTRDVQALQADEQQRAAEEEQRNEEMRQIRIDLRKALGLDSSLSQAELVADEQHDTNFQRYENGILAGLPKIHALPGAGDLKVELPELNTKRSPEQLQVELQDPNSALLQRISLLQERTMIADQNKAHLQESKLSLSHKLEVALQRYSGAKNDATRLVREMFKNSLLPTVSPFTVAVYSELRSKGHSCGLDLPLLTAGGTQISSLGAYFCRESPLYRLLTNCRQ